MNDYSSGLGEFLLRETDRDRHYYSRPWRPRRDDTLFKFHIDRYCCHPSRVNHNTSASLITNCLVKTSCFSQINVKAHDRPTRFLGLTIVDIFMSRYRHSTRFHPVFFQLYHRCAVLKEMGKEFLSGYISLVENEKDPRNLLLAFSITRVILIEFDISSSIEV